jgi:hypothetical protein
MQGAHLPEAAGQLGRPTDKVSIDRSESVAGSDDPRIGDVKSISATPWRVVLALYLKIFGEWQCDNAALLW